VIKKSKIGEKELMLKSTNVSLTQ